MGVRKTPGPMLKTVKKGEKKRKTAFTTEGILFTAGGLKVTAGHWRTSQSKKHPPTGP